MPHKESVTRINIDSEVIVAVKITGVDNDTIFKLTNIFYKQTSCNWGNAKRQTCFKVWLTILRP